MSEVKQLSILGIVIDAAAIIVGTQNFWHGIELLQVGIGVMILAGILHIVNILERMPRYFDTDLKDGYEEP